MFIARALLHNAAKIPAARLEELTEIVKCHFGVDTVDSGLLQEATEMDIRWVILTGHQVGHLNWTSCGSS